MSISPTVSDLRLTINANSISKGDPRHHATRTPLASFGREAIRKGKRHDNGVTGRHKHERTTALVLMDCVMASRCVLRVLVVKVGAFMG